MMRRAIACAALFVCAATLLLAASPSPAQIPQKMNYQMMLTDDSDQPLVDQSVQLVFRIYGQESGGSWLWSQTHDVMTNSIGVVSVILGSSNPISVDFSGPL